MPSPLFSPFFSSSRSFPLAVLLRLLVTSSALFISSSSMASPSPAFSLAQHRSPLVQIVGDGDNGNGAAAPVAAPFRPVVSAPTISASELCMPQNLHAARQLSAPQQRQLAALCARLELLEEDAELQQNLQQKRHFWSTRIAALEGGGRARIGTADRAANAKRSYDYIRFGRRSMPDDLIQMPGLREEQHKKGAGSTYDYIRFG